jgi:integrase
MKAIIQHKYGSPDDVLEFDPDVVSQTFNRIVKETGLRRIRFHDLRHTQATLWLKSGEPTYVVSRRLGHASEASHNGTYGRPNRTVRNVVLWCNLEACLGGPIR